ncbi:YqiA/YcfP family alpha/beta fold hydrolase [Aliiglaciecola sp. 2_MG-2023]|uniref:YqiA/YcfP family alpha/beta fold hydrolase n=1 Tax=Alteromonadaceae TaxID=72275 RepID=UPI0026E460C9|nr:MULTISPECIES: YqiA/YcfP family alpha/beta fold hydrolase [unclassified Aliiglaciecola]MDO6709472.1 YqiA/YcfP family alpha/beta fold hydrolase [Aliiglaciecola sp. 2_MG-2023]MDO6750986.1 YqiA/YcfP family alpha/beta fold hydrolase [Aliiglaciecola sp. 1_MG-2023]
MENVLIYIHGFMSSPQSVKAQQTLAYVRQHHPELTMEVPQVPNYPLDAAQMLEALARKYEGKKLGFIGSSMGGFMSTHLVEMFGGKAVLINPAVRPFELLKGFLGTHINPYTAQEFTLQEPHIQQLVDLNTTELKDPQAYWALLQTNDETLDYRQAEQKYANSRLTIEQGGDHSFQNYGDHLPEIFEFLLT